MSEHKTKLLKHFKEHFGHDATYYVRAPGRVNLIGEHIDYNGGLVLPIAISCEVRLLASRRDDGRFHLKSMQQDETYEGTLPEKPLDAPGWVNYVFGVIHEFQKEGIDVPGFDLLYDGDIPLGSGLSSSAAMEVSTAWLVRELLPTNHTRLEIAQLSQRAENIFAGVQCGLMDQGIIACGEDKSALQLDCAIPETKSVAIGFSKTHKFLIAHSGVHRGLSSSAYNERRSQGEEALTIINANSKETFANLCSVPMVLLEELRGKMDRLLYQRAKHVIGEQERVFQAINALRKGDAEQFGKLLNKSHLSLAVDYEVSCPELDELTSWLRVQPGVLGSRLTGAGFGGCTISLVEADRAGQLLDELNREFYGPRNIETVAFFSAAKSGVTFEVING